MIRSIQQTLSTAIPKDAKVILFGSRARNEARTDSDWDILVLLNKDKVEEHDHDDMYDATEEEVMPYFDKVKTLVDKMESLITFKHQQPTE